MNKPRDRVILKLEGTKTPEKENLGNKAKNGGPDRFQKQFRVLIVDDDTQIRRMLTRPVKRERENWEIREAENGVNALELLKGDSEFDLIILDLDMPEMMGTGVVEALEREGRQEAIDKIVIHSGTLSRDMNPHVMELVEGRVLSKPSDVSVQRELFAYAEAGKIRDWRPPDPFKKE